jgi:hypothetical protein
MSRGPDPKDPSGAVQPVKIYLSPRHLRILQHLQDKHGWSRSAVLAKLLERAQPTNIDPVTEVARRRNR